MLNNKVTCHEVDKTKIPHDLVKPLMILSYASFFQATPLADFAIMKRHYFIIRIIFTHTLSKSCFQKNPVVQYTPSTLNAIKFPQHMLAHLL